MLGIHESYKQHIDEMVELYGIHSSGQFEGKVNYYNAEKVLAVLCWIKDGDKFLLVQRSNDPEVLCSYLGYWAAVGGFGDNPNGILEKAIKEELNEELGWSFDFLNQIELEYGKPFTRKNELNGQETINFPAILDIKKIDLELPEIILNEESQDFAWLTPEEMKGYQMIIGSEYSLNNVLGREHELFYEENTKYFQY